MRGVHAPPVVRENVEDTQNNDEEDGRPLGFEANGYHTAGTETEERHKHPCDAPCALKDESEEQKDEENTTSEQEATE